MGSTAEVFPVVEQSRAAHSVRGLKDLQLLAAHPSFETR